MKVSKCGKTDVHMFPECFFLPPGMSSLNKFTNQAFAKGDKDCYHVCFFVSLSLLPARYVHQCCHLFFFLVSSVFEPLIGL